MDQEDLVGISEACRLLNVSETALRQWTDEGKIKAFITPGGHRRYLVTDLKKFMSSHHKSIGMKDLAAELEGTAHLHREIGMKVFSDAPYYGRLTGDTEENLAELGRRLLTSIIKYIMTPHERGNMLKEARNVGEDMGTTLAKLGLPLTDSMEAFIMHRDPILTVATDLTKKREAFSGRIVGAIPMATHVMDEALVSFVAAHQKYREGMNGEPKRDGV